MKNNDLTIENITNSLQNALECIKDLISRFDNDTKLEDISNIFQSVSDLHDLVIKSVKHTPDEEIYTDDFLENIVKIFKSYK